jgi:hypothetical protein
MVVEPMSECVMLGMLSSWAVTVLFSWSGLAFFFVHLLLWFVLDYILLQLVQVRTHTFPTLATFQSTWSHILFCCNTVVLMMV